jgi:hypothetical protein
VALAQPVGSAVATPTDGTKVVWRDRINEGLYVSDVASGATTALAVGYLPARGVALPAGLGWLETVVRTALTPAALLIILVLLVVPLWREWRPRPGLALAGDRPVADRAAPRG